VTLNSEGKENLPCSYRGCKKTFVFDPAHHNRIMCDDHRNKAQRRVKKVRKNCAVPGCKGTFIDYPKGEQKNCIEHQYAKPTLRGPRNTVKPDIINECSASGFLLEKKALSLILKQPNPVGFTKELVKQVPQNVVVIGVIHVEQLVLYRADLANNKEEQRAVVRVPTVRVPKTTPQTRTAAALDKALKEVKRDKPIAPPTPEVAPKSWWGKLFGTKGGET